jgi:hypothetical protein
MTATVGRAVSDDDELPTSRPRRRWVRPVVVAAVLLIGIGAWTALSASLVLDSRRSAEAGRDRLVALSVGDPLELDLDVLAADLRIADAELRRAEGDLASPLLWPVRPLPVLGRQLASARALAGSSRAVVNEAALLVDSVAEGRQRGDDAEDRLDVLASIDEGLSRLGATLDAAELGPDDGLIGPLVQARNEAADRFAELRAEVDRGQVVVGGLRSFLDDSQYLLLGANNAEMETGGGMYLSVGELSIIDGAFDLADFLHSSSTLVAAEVAIVDDGVAQRWGHIRPTTDFRKLNVTPRFERYSGPQAIEMWQALTGRRPSGVLVIDPAVIQAVLGVVGPVEVDGQWYDGTGLLQFALVEQYRQYTQMEDQGDRRDLVGDIANAAVAALGERSWDPLELIRSLRPVAESRRLLAYSEDEAQQAMWRVLGVDGAMDGDEVLVNLANLAGSKIDPFVDLSIDAHHEHGPDGSTLVLDVEIHNGVPPDVEGFALGSLWAVGLEDRPGTYWGRLVVYAPGATRALRVEPQLPLEVLGREGELAVVAGRLEVGPQATERLRVEVELAPGVERITILPAARPRPVRWSFDGETWYDTAPRVIELRRP